MRFLPLSTIIRYYGCYSVNTSSAGLLCREKTSPYMGIGERSVSGVFMRARPIPSPQSTVFYPPSPWHKDSRAEQIRLWIIPLGALTLDRGGCAWNSQCK